MNDIVRERVTLGSWMKLWPDLALGGNSPVQESFKHSMIVCEKMHVWESIKLIGWGWLFRNEMEHTVLPAPLGPTIRVKGLKKVMTFLFSGSKLRMPLISILSTVLIFASLLFFASSSESLTVCSYSHSASLTRTQYSNVSID